jgi:cytochrome c oxidase cbb3-type subunit 3
MRRSCHLILGTLSLLLAVSLTACKREDRGFRVAPPNAVAPGAVRLVSIEAGGSEPDQPISNMYEENAYAMGEGQRLFDAYNCSGCHAHGGGGMGPALMDDKWIYGSEPQQIYSTIMQGRPNGMPSFRDKIPNHQVWELVAFVRSMSGLANKQAASGRDEHMNGPPPPNSTSTSTPVVSSEPGDSPGSPPPEPPKYAPSATQPLQPRPSETQPVVPHKLQF